MALSRTKPAPRVCATYGCRNVVDNDGIGRGFKRCAWCREGFARSTPKSVDAKLVQGTLFEKGRRERPVWSPPAPAPKPSSSNDAPSHAPAPPGPTEEQLTTAAVRKLRAAGEAAAKDARAARLLELTRGGLRLAAAIEQIETEERDHERS